MTVVVSFQLKLFLKINFSPTLISSFYNYYKYIKILLIILLRQHEFITFTIVLLDII